MIRVKKAKDVVVVAVVAVAVAVATALARVANRASTKMTLQWQDKLLPPLINRRHRSRTRSALPRLCRLQCPSQHLRWRTTHMSFQPPSSQLL